MKKLSHTKFYTWSMALSALLTCWNGSVVTTTSQEPQSIAPDINFYGTLEDHINTASIESILIGGRYESIPVYQQAALIKEQDAVTAPDPKQNKTLINLQDIKSIALAHPESPTASSIKVNNKIYIQIIVESLHGTKKHYLVESMRKISCKEIDKGADIKTKPTLQDRDLNFIHVKKLTIQGYRSNTAYQAPKIDVNTDTPFTRPAAGQVQEKEKLMEHKNEFKDNAAQLLHAIEENVKNMPLDNPTAFETMRSTILTLLKSLRDQLQKFLDMIK